MLVFINYVKYGKVLCRFKLSFWLQTNPAGNNTLRSPQVLRIFATFCSAVAYADNTVTLSAGSSLVIARGIVR